MRRLCLVLALSLVGAGCAPFGDREPLSEMELQRVSGDVVVLRGGERLFVDDSISLEERDVIETHDDSEAKLRLEGTRIAAMLQHSEVEVIGGDSLHARTGSVLVKAEEKTRLSFDQVVAITTSGTFRVDQGIATARAGVYRGSMSLTSPGEPRLTVTDLYEAPVTANDLPAQARPYHLDITDPWDTRWLSNIVSLQQDLERLAKGLGNQVGNKKPGLAFFRALAGVKDVGFIKPYLSESPEDLLVGFTIADNSVAPIASSFRRAFRLFDASGAWGIVAALMDVRGGALLADLERIIVGTGVVARGRGGRAAFTIAAAESAGSGGIAPSGPGAAPGGGGSQGPGGGGNGEGGGKKPKPTPTPECEDVVECTVSRLRPTPSPTGGPLILPLDFL